MKRLFGILVCGMLFFSACGQEEKPAEKKEPIYETLDAAKEAHLERCPEERLEDVIPVAEDTYLAIYSDPEELKRAQNEENVHDVYALVRYLIYQETEKGFELKEETALYTLQNCSVTIDNIWLGKGKMIEISAEGFADDPYAEEQPNVEGYDGFYRQENGWFGVRVEVK